MTSNKCIFYIYQIIKHGLFFIMDPRENIEEEFESKRNQLWKNKSIVLDDFQMFSLF